MAFSRYSLARQILFRRERGARIAVQKMGRDVAQPSPALERERVAAFEIDHLPIEVMRLGLACRRVEIREARHDTETARHTRHAELSVSWMRLDASRIDEIEHLVLGPIDDRSPCPYPVAGILIGDGRTGAPPALFPPDPDDADDRPSLETAHQLSVYFRYLQLWRAKPHRRRRPAGDECDRAEILIASDIRSPAAFPSLQQTALLAAYHDKLRSKHECKLLADGKGILPFDHAEIGVDQQARSRVADAIEVFEGHHRSSLTILSTGDPDGHRGMLAKHIGGARRDRDGRNRKRAGAGTLFRV